MNGRPGRLAILVGVSLSVGLVGVARAQAPAPAPDVAASAPAVAKPMPAPEAMPAPVAATPEALPPSALDAPTLVGTAAATPTRGPTVSYGVGARLRVVSVPRWLLNLFTKQNVPLTSWGTGLELLRRKGEFDFILSFSYQSMSPPDGNWLGRGHDANVDTDYVQFKGLGLAGADVSFVWHSFLTDWFGLHYGAGLGLGIVTGKILRTSDSNDICTEANAGDVSQCHPVSKPPAPPITCTAAGCSDSALAATEGGVDDPTDPHRFRESNVPPVLPIVNVLVGVDFRLPHVRGWEAKIEGGFYDAFFFGGTLGYTF
ncbi:MAG TPA: hypothetical protein VHJ20_20145 [Polyangia bacterium]|nr:hypothetical protein [Polyangia bacterium]